MSLGRNRVRWVAILGILAIITIIAVQGYWIYQLWNYKAKEFSQNAQVALFKVAQQLAELNESVLPNTGIVNQVTSNYFVVNINDNIKADHLEYFLRKEFQNFLITEDFEYGIYDCSNDQMVYGNYINTNEDPVEELKFKTKLPTHEGFTYYFGVHFPHTETAIVSSIMWAFFLTLLLIAAIAVYIYAIITIVRQNELSELQKDFINNMTHEFKTPLSSIKLATNALATTPIVEGETRLVKLTQIIDTQNKRLNSHVERILQLAKLERDKFLLQKEKIDLNELIDEILPATQLRVQESNGILNLDLLPGQVYVLADRLHLNNVIDNLIDNAIKYSLNNPSIFISSSRQKGKIYLTIADKGVGMNLNIHRKVFDKFYRHHTGNIHDVKGFGLGLFYVKNICKAHKWSLKIDSTLSIGTKITIIIPEL